MLVLDHIFILTSPKAPEADSLIELGLLEGPSNDHPGQGTSNRRFFMRNTTLEFLFIQNIAEAINGAGRDLKFVERAIDADASPFGLVTRCSNTDTLPAFPHWKYQSDYFPKPMSFLVGNNSTNFSEPVCICMPPALQAPKSKPTPNNPDWSLTALELSVPSSTSSATLSIFGKCELVNIQHNQDHHLKLVFNHANQGKKHFFPDLQLTIEC